jgi:signal recognition particle receptor subunit beta
MKKNILDNMNGWVRLALGVLGLCTIIFGFAISNAETKRTAFANKEDIQTLKPRIRANEDFKIDVKKDLAYIREDMKEQKTERKELKALMQQVLIKVGN